MFVSALSENAHYEEIVDFLATVKNATRSEIADALTVKGGGNLSQLLKDLELCSLIESYTPFDASSNSANIRYQISDNYLQFYFRFIRPQEKKISSGDFRDNPHLGLNLGAFEQYLGFAFERWCRTEARQIAQILGFAGIQYTSGAYFRRSTKKTPAPSPGFQIDLIFQRADRVYTLCELKHTTRLVDVQTAKTAIDRFHHAKLNPRYATQRVLISTSGATEEVRNGGYFDRIITLEELL